MWSIAYYMNVRKEREAIKKGDFITLIKSKMILRNFNS